MRYEDVARYTRASEFLADLCREMPGTPELTAMLLVAQGLTPDQDAEAMRQIVAAQRPKPADDDEPALVEGAIFRRQDENSRN